MSLSAYVVKNMALEMKDDSHPREAILKHAKVNLLILIFILNMTLLRITSFCLQGSL